MLKQVLVSLMVVTVLVQCTKEKTLTDSVTFKTRYLRSTASLSPAQIFTVEKPLLHSSDQISISESDKTLFCELGALNLSESPEGINFICGYEQPTQQGARAVSTTAFGLGKLWLANAKPPTHLWINGVLHFCRSSNKTSLQCFTSPTKGNNS